MDVEIGEASKLARGGQPGTYKFEGATLSNLTPSHPQYKLLEGILILDIEPSSKAGRAGLQKGDIILSVNRKPTPNLEKFSTVTESVDGALALHIQRGNSKLFVVVQ